MLPDSINFCMSACLHMSAYFCPACSQAGLKGTLAGEETESGRGGALRGARRGQVVPHGRAAVAPSAGAPCSFVSSVGTVCTGCTGCTVTVGRQCAAVATCFGEARAGGVGYVEGARRDLPDQA